MLLSPLVSTYGPFPRQLSFCKKEGLVGSWSSPLTEEGRYEQIQRQKDSQTKKSRLARLYKPLVRNKHRDTHRVTQRSSLFSKVTDSLINGQTQALLVTNRYKFRQRSTKLHKYVYKYAPAGGQPRIRRNLSN